jgi:hypothetical protein
MDKFSPPALNLRYICITSKPDAVVAAQISSYFNEPGTYFIVLAFPRLEVPYADAIDFQKDDYIAQLMGNQAAARINNVVARLRPSTVFLAGMNEGQKSFIRAYLPHRMLMEVDTCGDVDRLLGPLINSQFESALACKSSEVVQGLLFARYANKRLSIDEDAPPLPQRHFVHGPGLAVIENNRTSDEVVAVNYALSIGADVAFVKPIERADLQPVQKWIYEWKKQRSDYAYQQLRQMLAERVDGINFPDYEFATFFTRGFPYGLLLNNLVPFTHVFIHPVCDLFVVNNIASELYPGVAGSAVVFSPKLFQREETDDVIKILSQKNYLVRALLGKDATVDAMAFYGEHFPFDLLHVCSHGGETNGYHVVQEFKDRMGQPHTLEYEEIVGFSPADHEQVAVVRKVLFRKFDEIKWMAEELKRLPQYVFEDMRKALRLRQSGPDSTRRTRIDSPIYASCHIECSDSIHQGQFQSLASNSYPTIFNNTCSSWYEIAINFVAAGARAYFGTLWRINNAVAREAASVFYKHASAGGTLLDSFYEMTRSIKDVHYRNIYFYWGLHFNTLKPPVQKPDQEVFNVLVSSLFEWRREFNSTKDPELKRQASRVVRFLSHELSANFTRSHLAQLNLEIKARLSDLEELSEERPGSDDDFQARGVVDL